MTHSMRQPDGVLIEHGVNGQIHVDTARCVHCQYHFEWNPRVARNIGWCHGCGGWVCGKKECVENCVNWEQKLDNREQGRSKFHKRIRITVPR